MLPKASKSNEFNERKFFRSRQQYPLMSAIVAHDTTKTEVKRIIRYFFSTPFLFVVKNPPNETGKVKEKLLKCSAKCEVSKKRMLSLESARACVLCAAHLLQYFKIDKNI